MESLGLKQIPGSGNGWVAKEDGSNDFVLCQLKSTDAQSIKVNQKDIRMLEKNAATEHKYPLFAIQFLNTGELWLMAKPEDFPNITEYIKIGSTEKPIDMFANANYIDMESVVQAAAKEIKSASKARESFYKEKAKKFDKTKSAR